MQQNTITINFKAEDKKRIEKLYRACISSDPKHGYRGLSDYVRELLLNEVSEQEEMAALDAVAPKHP